MIIAGIDPGLAATGFGIIEKTGTRITPREWGVLRSSGKPLSERLGKIYNGLDEVLRKYSPDIVAVEEVFTGRNPRSALLVGHARGVALLVAALGGYDVREFAAKSVKQSVVGHGGASKEQVGYMVNRILGLGSKRLPKDASDALAVAICCLLRCQRGISLDGRLLR